MKKLIAIAAATAMLGAGSAAFAAERLNDADMDAVSAGGLDLNFDFSQNNVASVENLQAVEVKSGGYATKGGEIENKIYVSQNTWISQKNKRFVIFD
jgi:hypothetical protein